MKKQQSISEAELELMKVLWSVDEPVTAQFVQEVLKEKGWKYSTVATLFSRLTEKDAVTYEKRGRFFYYSPKISEEAYTRAQTQNLISKLYNGSVKNLVVALFENKQISESDIAEIKEKFNL